MKLLCYLKDRPAFDIRPAGITRQWMENTIDRFAYRCLPLNIANSHGWEIYCSQSFKAIWNGGPNTQDILIKPEKEFCDAITHFGSGVLTFHVPCVFRTESQWNLMVMGPPNRPKRGIQALTGVIETDWSPYSFTMNWIFTEPNFEVEFSEGEPFCFFFPIPQGYIEHVEPSFSDMHSNPELYKQHSAWIESRQNFNEDLAKPQSQAQSEKWQRKYFHGLEMNGELGTSHHQTKIRAKEFVLENGIIKAS